MSSPSLVADVGAATANAFIDADAADDYLSGRLNVGAWDGASPDDRDRALIEATRELTLLPYRGSRVTSTQALAWPRQFCPNPDEPSIVYLGNIQLLYYDATVISPRVQQATCELALEFLRAGSDDVAALDSKIGIVREKIDVIETQYAEPFLRAQGLARYPRVVSLLAPLLDAGGLEVVRV